MERDKGTWRRTFNRYVGLVAAAIGVAIVVGSFMLLQDFLWWYLGVGIGLLIALLGFVYAANPVLTSERQYPTLRKEVDRFIGLVRQLNKAAREGSEADRQRVKSEMHDAVERIDELAGKEG